MYEGFAEVYDELMGNVRYDAWASFYARMLAEYGITQGHLCECACGTASLTIPLARLGYRMTGIDLSQEMLWIAQQKARKAGAAIPFVRQDMRNLRLHRPVDAVLATCDGVNYLLTDEDVRAFFKSAYQALRPGGGLFFDISTPWKLKNELGNQMICEDNDHITYLWQNSYNEKTDVVDMHLCFFVAQGKDDLYRRIDEEQKQKAHDMEHLCNLLRMTGFEHIQVFGNHGRLEAPAEHEQRWHFAALRPAEETVR